VKYCAEIAPELTGDGLPLANVRHPGTNKTTTARVEMKARVIRWSNQLNKLSDEIADH
jgi:hypothetical protein